MKPILSLISLFLMGQLLIAQSGNFSVQLGAFNTKVDADYFKSMPEVTYYKDHNDIHRYLIMGIGSKADAEKKAEAARKAGYRAVIINNDEVAKNCRITCNTKPIEPELSSLNWIFFDFDRAELRSASQSQLNNLVQVLNSNPTYTAELSAHIDSKGSNDYNVALSQRRANNAKNYVTGKGIGDNRIKTSTNGENAPIAKNELASGTDTETGRQFNRRVEIRIFDASGKQVNVVNAPEVPSSLKN